MNFPAVESNASTPALEARPIVPSFWTPTSTNPKTGDIPQQWIGRTQEETLLSCSGCPLLWQPGQPIPRDRPTCYALRGTARMAAAGVHRRAARVPHAYTLSEALRRRPWAARAARFAAIGCACATRDTLHSDIAAVHAEGLAALAYCHHTPEAPQLAGLVTASVETTAGAEAAFARGFLKVALVVPKHTTQREMRSLGRGLGVKALVCPADASSVERGGRTWYRTTCNDCRLCDGTSGPPTLIGFPEKTSRSAPTLLQIQ